MKDIELKSTSCEPQSYPDVKFSKETSLIFPKLRISPERVTLVLEKDGQQICPLDLCISREGKIYLQKRKIIEAHSKIIEKDTSGEILTI